MDFEFDIHFLHGTISLLISIALLPMLLSAILSNTFAKQLQKKLIYLLLLNITWNSLALLEQLPASYITDSTRMTFYTAFFAGSNMATRFSASSSILPETTCARAGKRCSAF